MLVGYARCSPDAQDLTAQHTALTTFGVKSNRIYVDHGCWHGRDAPHPLDLTTVLTTTVTTLLSQRHRRHDHLQPSCLVTVSARPWQSGGSAESLNPLLVCCKPFAGNGKVLVSALERYPAQRAMRSPPQLQDHNPCRRWASPPSDTLFLHSRGRGCPAHPAVGPNDVGQGVSTPLAIRLASAQT
jgi:hypothetical protein